MRKRLYLIISGIGLLSIGLADEPNLLKQLDLSSQQIKEIRIQQQSTLHLESQLKIQLENEQKMLTNELNCAVPDPIKIKEFIKNINKVRGEIYEHRISVRVQTLKTFTPSQRLRYQELEETSLKQNRQQTKQMGSNSSNGSGQRMGR